MVLAQVQGVAQESEVVQVLEVDLALEVVQVQAVDQVPVKEVGLDQKKIDLKLNFIPLSLGTTMFSLK